MFNVVFLNKLLLTLVCVLNRIISSFKYKFLCYNNLIFSIIKKIYNFQIKRLKRNFKLILNSNILITLIYRIFYLCIIFFIFFWPLKDTGLGIIIFRRYILYNGIFTFDKKLYFEHDINNISIIINFCTYTYISWVVYFSLIVLPFTLIPVFYFKTVIRLWFTTIKISAYLLSICIFISGFWVVMKFLLTLSWYIYLNTIYHSLLCILIIHDYYTLSVYNTFELVFLILCVIEVYCTDFIYFLLNQLNCLLSWATNSYFYLIINLLIELITKVIPKFTIILINNFVYFIKQISYIKNPLYVIILNLVVIILFILIGGIIPLVERKYLSLIQRRVGPKFVGYNGRLQFIADALKLLFKEIIFLINTNKVSFVIIPIFLLNLNIFLLINLVWVNNLFYIDNEYFILLILLIELITSIYTAYIGFVVKNKYTIIASTRLLNGVIVFEIFLITIYFYLYIINSKLNLDNIYFNQIFNVKLKLNLIILPPIVYAVLLNLKKVPFDIIEAETELIMGYTTEHSGFLGGALLLIEYLHLFFWSLLILTLFLI